MKTKMLIVAAPSGGGKSSLCNRLLAEIPQLVDTITYTTRPMREGEREGFPYHFVTPQRFLELRGQGFFVEWAEVHGRLYGTPMHQLEDAWKSDRWIIMDVDVQGAATFKRLYPTATSIFILPPSLDELRRRLEARDKGKTYDIELRLKNAEREIAEAHWFDHQIVNQEFDKAYAELKKIVAEAMKSH